MMFRRPNYMDIYRLVVYSSSARHMNNLKAGEGGRKAAGECVLRLQ